jgi:hypothetical protein
MELWSVEEYIDTNRDYTLHNVCSSLNIVIMNIYRTIRWTGQVAHTCELKSGYITLERLDGRNNFGALSGLEDNIKIALK